MDTCFGDHKAEIERYIGETLKLDQELDKRYIFVGRPGTGKSSLLLIIAEIFRNDPYVLIVHDADLVKLDRNRYVITFAATNKEPSPLCLYDSDILIHTTGDRLPKQVYAAVMETLMNNPCDVARICFGRLYREKGVLIDTNGD